jgi:hypothetical protein
VISIGTDNGLVTRIVLEGSAEPEPHVEDGGTIAYVSIDDSGDAPSLVSTWMAVGLQISSEIPPGRSPGAAVARQHLAGYHPVVADLAGKRVRVTIEVLP